MIREERYKYVYYINHSPELFDLNEDPEELTNLAEDPDYIRVRRARHQKLLSICDPHEVELRAKRRQAEQLQSYGGREAVIARGDLGFTPPPGISADFS